MKDKNRLATVEAIIERAVDTGAQWASRRSELVIDEKSAGQFASNVDVELERQIRAELAEQFSGETIIGEELGGALAGDETGWAIDPIDGTSNFILGLPIWGISIGYIEQGCSVLGALALPELGLTLSASSDNGLRVNGKAFGHFRPSESVKIVALGENDYESGAETDIRAQFFRNEGFSVVRYRCAVFSLGMAAIGRLHGYIENGCGLWDLAAADIICREAGMAVETQKVSEGRYFIDARWRNSAEQ